MHFGSVADVDCFLVISMHVVDEGKVVISVGMPRVDLGAYLEVLDSHRILFLLKVGQPKIVLELSVLWMELA